MKRVIKVYKAIDRIDLSESMFIIPMEDDKSIGHMFVTNWDEGLGTNKNMVLRYTAILAVSGLQVPHDENRMINPKLVMEMGEADL